MTKRNYWLGFLGGVVIGMSSCNLIHTKCLDSEAESYEATQPAVVKKIEQEPDCLYDICYDPELSCAQWYSRNE